MAVAEGVVAVAAVEPAQAAELPAPVEELNAQARKRLRLNMYLLN